MAIARKCDRCGKLYEKYDDVECNGMEVNRVLLSNGIVNKEAYDLCPECCLEFVRWLVDLETTVVKLSMDESTDEADTQVEIKEKINKVYGVPGPLGSNMYPKVFADSPTILNTKEEEE